MKDTTTKRSRGFGFVIFASTSSVERALATKDLRVDGRKVHACAAATRRRAVACVASRPRGWCCAVQCVLLRRRCGRAAPLVTGTPRGCPPWRGAGDGRLSRAVVRRWMPRRRCLARIAQGRRQSTRRRRRPSPRQLWRCRPSRAPSRTVTDTDTDTDTVTAVPLTARYLLAVCTTALAKVCVGRPSLRLPVASCCEAVLVRQPWCGVVLTVRAARCPVSQRSCGCTSASSGESRPRK
jgi:hypothetical protein